MTREQRLLEAFQQAAEVHRIATRAVRKAQEESRRLGVANVYSRDGRLYFDAAQRVVDEPDVRDSARRESSNPGVPGAAET